MHTELAKVLLNELAKEELGAASIYYAKMLMELHLPSSDSPELVTKCESITVMVRCFVYNHFGLEESSNFIIIRTEKLFIHFH